MGPQEGEVWETIPVNFLLAQQLQYNVDELKTTVERNCERFNAEQRNVFEAAMDSVNNNKGKMLFIHVVERPLFAILLLQQFGPKERSLCVLPLLELQHYYLMVVRQHIPVLVFLQKH